MNKVQEQHRDDLVAAITAMIESGAELDWKPGWFSSGYGDGDINALTGKAYRGENSLLTFYVRKMRGYKESRWLTMIQANELGGHVKKGEKGLKLIKFSEYDIKTKKKPDKAAINALPEDERKQYIKDNIRIYANSFIVFNVEQCEGLTKLKPVEKKTMTPAELARQETTFETIIRNSSAPVFYDGGDSAFYRPATDDIHLPEIERFKTKQDYYSTAMHEIAHSTGHETRLNRNILNGFGSEEYAKEELRAEIASVFLQGDLGVSMQGEILETHTAYIKSWRESLTDKTVLTGIVKDAKGIADYIEREYLFTSQKDKVQVKEHEKR